VGGNPFERIQVIAALKEVLRTSRGREIKNTIKAGGVQKTLSIEPGSGILGVPLSNTNLIRLDPYYHPYIRSTAGNIVGGLRRIIGHELGHTIGIGDVGPGQMLNVNLTENPIVGALGMPHRTQYGPPSLPGGVLLLPFSSPFIFY
jgi:hypothetical protein